MQSVIHRAQHRLKLAAADITDPLQPDYAVIGLAGISDRGEKSEGQIRRKFERLAGWIDAEGEAETLGVEIFDYGSES